MTLEIDSLDRALSRAGSDVVLQRRIGTSNDFDQVTVRATVRSYNPEELVNGVDQTDSRLIMSQSQILTAGWPSLAGGDPFPIKGDRFVINGKPRTVEVCDPFDIDGVFVRFECRVLG